MGLYKQPKGIHEQFATVAFVNIDKTKLSENFKYQNKTRWRV